MVKKQTVSLEIGRAAPIKVIPMLAIVTFVFGIICSVVLPNVVQEEELQINAQRISHQDHNTVLVKESRQQ
ncbi:MAG: hypothetical protein CSB48_05780 [Proteobacteria bacterium]|nr:MAG: hypothetical protein CSB48_05780 [Pseudomonadota bacterium]